MRTFQLADWTTVRGQSAAIATQVTQDETTWLDLEAYQDVIIYLDVREITSGTPPGNITFYFETAPSKDDMRDGNGNPLFFQPVASAALSAGSGNTTVLRALMLTAASPNVPLARYLRWRVVGVASNAWDATFRAIVAANAPGMG